MASDLAQVIDCTGADASATFRDRLAWIDAGDIMGSGTVGGGCGDVMELEVSGLGVLTNTIVAPHVLQVPTMPIHILD